LAPHDEDTVNALPPHQELKKGVSERRKRGTTHKYVTKEEEKLYLEYSMITDLFVFDELKTAPTFAIKRYKDSLYRGELKDQ
jgi:hypothetical protein